MAEPILWANKSRRVVQTVVDGEPRIERIPQRGHAGNTDYDRPDLARGQRWERYIKMCGTDARVPLTNGAAHLDADDPYGKHIRAKGRALGWIPRGACPCALLLTGELRSDHVVSREVRRAEPCPPRTYTVDRPCTHLLAEQKARQEAHAERERKRAGALKGDVEKLLEAQKKQTEALVDSVTEGIQKAVESIADRIGAPPAPPPAPAGAPKPKKDG